MHISQKQRDLLLTLKVIARDLNINRCYALCYVVPDSVTNLSHLIGDTQISTGADQPKRQCAHRGMIIRPKLHRLPADM